MTETGNRLKQERSKSSGIRTLLTATGIGALWGSGAGLIIASKGTGHVPWEAVFGAPVVIGVVLGAVVGGILVALRHQRSRESK